MTSHHRDYYKILQVDSEAEPEVIAAAYRRLSLKYHPDTNRAVDATLRMQQINEAYDVLKDPARRARYDRDLAHGISSFGDDVADEQQSPPEHRRRAGDTKDTAADRTGEAVEHVVHAFRAAPRGAKAVKAFAPEPVYCDANPFQEHTLPGGCWIDVGFEWIARDVATVTSNWRALTLSVTVDGEHVDRSQRHSRGPDAVTLPCATRARYGYVFVDALFIPPLPLGDHVVKWTVSFTRDVDDGWTIHPRGSELAVTSFLHIVKAV
jgi:curved DNA-binding protein CbpA